MDEREHIRVFNEHVNIAKRMFIELPNQKEGMEIAEYATHVAILTYKQELGSLSTHVHYVASKYRNKFVRDGKKWSGTHPCTSKSVQEKYPSSHKYTKVYRKKVHLSLPKIIIYANENNPTLRIDIQDIIKKLEERYKIFNGRLSIVVEGWMAGETEKQIAKRAGCSRQWVSHLKKIFREKLKDYQKQWN
jgi:hypothetical protein